MEEKIKELTNQELMQVYNMIMDHLEYLENEKKKVTEEEEKK